MIWNFSNLALALLLKHLGSPPWGPPPVPPPQPLLTPPPCEAYCDDSLCTQELLHGYIIFNKGCARLPSTCWLYSLCFHTIHHLEDSIVQTIDKSDVCIHSYFT